MAQHPSVTPSAAAEDAMAYVPLRPGGARTDEGWAMLSDQGLPHRFMRTVARIRAAPDDDLDALIASARAWFARRDALPFTWWLGPSTTPPALAERLAALGARPDAEGQDATALALEAAPPASSARRAGEDLVVREVEGFEDFVVLQELLTGRTLAVTTSGHGPLSGGGTRPAARGRGAYAALVRHRWEVAQAAGLPALITQASSQSRPILERLGFRTVAPLTVFVDEG